HTSSKRDWSSDVCSSDLDRGVPGIGIPVGTPAGKRGSPTAQVQESQPCFWRISETQGDRDPTHVFKAQALGVVRDQLRGLHPIDQEQPGPGRERVGLDFCGAGIDFVGTGFNIDGGPRLIAASVAHLRTLAWLGTPCHGSVVGSSGSPSGSNPEARRLDSTRGALPDSQANAGRSPTACWINVSPTIVSRAALET